MTVEKTRVTKYRWFWAWQDEAEETWLGEMSGKGYHLTAPGFPCVYTFHKAEPRNYVYRLDYQTFRKKDKQEYVQLFRDAGWEYLGEMSGWQYFRKEAKTGEDNEIFTDVESKVAKYRRVLAFLVIFYPVLTFVFWGRSAGFYSHPWWIGAQAVILLILLFFTYAIFRLAMRIRQLRKL